MNLKNKWVALAITSIGTLVAMAASQNSGPVSASDQQAQATDLVGKQAQQKVDLFTGSFGYTVPINCPPARNGSEPSLVLAYSSAGDNGWCGMGWNLAIGSIDRNVRDGFPMLYSTGNPATPLNAYDDTKGFILDLFGKSYKLFSVATNGTVEYRAETDTDFLRCFFDTTNNKWTVYDKSGTAYYFGETSNTRLSKTGWTSGATSTFHWALDQIVTATGDWTTIAYADNTSPYTGQSEQTLYPTQMNYNGHTNFNGYSSNFTPPNSIIFQTEVRPDWRFSFRSGFRTESDRRLTNIVCQANSQNVWSYRLMYGISPATARSLLTNVVVYGYSGTTPSPYLTNSFAYQANPNGMSFGSTIVWSNMVLTGPDGLGYPEVTEVNQAGGFNYALADLVDMDGDGLPDRVICDTNVSPNKYMVQKNLGLQGTGGSFGSQYLFGPISTGVGNPSDSNPFPDASGYAELNTANGRIRDINGDGLPDRVLDYWKPFDQSINPNYTPYTNFTIAFNTGGAFSSPTRWAITNFMGGYDANNVYSAYESVEGGGTVGFGGFNVQLGVGLFDLNGDLLPDRVQSGFAGMTNSMTNLYVQYNTGSGFTQMRTYPYRSQNCQGLDAGTISQEAAFETQNSHFLDLNGDGLPDHIMWPFNPTNGYNAQYMPHPTSYYAVEYNDGYSFESTNTYTGLPGSYDVWPGVVAQTNNGSITYNGAIFYSDAMVDPPFCGLYDLNGDGLPDRVVLDQSSYGYAQSRWFVYLNNGHGFNTTPIVLTNIENQGQYQMSSGALPWWSPEGSYNGSAITTLMDINGDGLLDRVMAVYYSSSPSANYFLVQLNNGPYPDLLTNVNNGIGGNLAVTYNSSSAYDNRVDPTSASSVSHMPFPRQVVSAVAESDAVNPAQVTSYNYAAGYYDGPRREFHGFGVVTETDPTLRSTVTYFHTGGGRNYTALGEYQDTNSSTGLGNFAKMGMPYRVEEYGNDANLYHLQVNQVNQTSLGNGRYFPFTALTFDCDYTSGGSSNVAAMQFAYDFTTGNLTNKIEYGKVNGFNANGFSYTDADTTDTRQNHTIYAPISGNSYIVNLPGTNNVTDVNNNVIRETRYLYNGNSGTTLAKLTRIASGYYATNGYGYNSYGLISLKTNAVGVVAEITYDSTDNTFPATTRLRANPSSDGGSADFTTTTVYDARSGDVASSTDPAGVTTTNSFDAFCRPTETDKIPAGSTTLVWTKKYRYPALMPMSSGQAVNYTDVIVNDGVGGFTNRTYIDGFGRTLQTRIQGENGNFRVISTAYDGRGKAFLTTWPVFVNGVGFTKPYNPQMAMLTGYDSYGRVATNRAVTINVDGNGAISSTTISGGDTSTSPLGVKTWTYANGTDPWWIVFTDEDGKTRRYQLDAFGRTNQIQEVDGSSTYSTTLKYDLADNLTSIINSIGETNYWAFNDAGDEVASADPYLGQWTYVRDFDGRLRVQTDARGDVVSNSYVNASGYQDPLNRVQVQTVFNFNPTNSTLAPAYTNTYVYDSSDDNNYNVPKGFLYKTVDSQGYEKAGYDSLARTINATRHLNINNQDYTTKFTYNDGDKVTSTAYPNSGPTITNQYFNGGSIKQVSLYGGSQNYYTVSAGAYDEFGHVTNFVYGNGLSTTRSFYQVSKRLKSVTAGSGGSIFSRTFTYSPGEDILTLNGTGETNISVTYDNLHRIKSFSSLTGSYAYDAVGNLTNNIESGSSQTYGYGVRRPEAVKTVGSAKYLYDLCGNMIVRKGDTATPQSLSYNAENRLVRFASAGTNFMLVTFGYDAGGARLWKWNNQNPTNLQVWIGNYYEEKGGKVLFHIFANGQQVCTFETNSALYNGIGTDTNHVAYYYNEDNINSSCALSSGATPISQQEVNVYYPFGRTMAGTLQASFQVSRRFTGQILDGETGLYYFNARYYDPELGRFTQPDSRIADLGNPQSYNKYTYCVNNPLRYTDPDGRAPSDWANAWSSVINRGATYVSAGPSHWIWNGTVGSLNTFVGGLAEPLRFGSTAGALSGSGHATAGQIALGTLQEAGRAAAIIPVGAAIGKGTGALVTSLTAGGEDEAVGELSGLISGCFVAGTLVATETGCVEIQNVKVGDLVWSYSFEAQKWQLRAVEATPVHDYSGDFITINVGNAVVESTGNHPVWVVSGDDLANRPTVGDLSQADQSLTPFGRWVESRSLRVGDEVFLVGGATATINSLWTTQGHLLVYNLRVTGNHTYAVSQKGVLVHNKSAQVKPIPRDLPNANQALRDAKEAWDVPKSAQPDKTIKPGTPEGDAAGLDGRNVKLYEYTNNKGEKIHVRQDKPATYNENGAGDQGPHFNSGPANDKLKRHDYYDQNK
jgi:RHS repeat-associated protein